MRRGWFLPITATLGFAFLYAPIISLVIFSFNESRLVTVWSGFSTKWYGELFADPQMLGAAWLSLQIAFVAATIALVLGTLCAVALVRFRRFRGRTVLAGTVSAPLVMPDVITGLALLLLFVAMEATHRLAGRPRHRSPSSSPTPPSAWPMSPSWCSRASPTST